MNWQTDTVIFQTETIVNNFGSSVVTYTDGASVLCDVQDINKEFIFKRYGLTTNTSFKQIFDHSNASWIVGSQVKFSGLKWWVKLVNVSDKMSDSNHTYVLLERVS